MAMAARNITGMAIAQTIGMSQNYVSKRLRDQGSFTLADVEAIGRALGADMTILNEGMVAALAASLEPRKLTAKERAQMAPSKGQAAA